MMGSYKEDVQPKTVIYDRWCSDRSWRGAPPARARSKGAYDYSHTKSNKSAILKYDVKKASTPTNHAITRYKTLLHGGRRSSAPNKTSEAATTTFTAFAPARAPPSNCIIFAEITVPPLPVSNLSYLKQLIWQLHFAVNNGQ